MTGVSSFRLMSSLMNWNSRIGPRPSLPFLPLPPQLQLHPNPLVLPPPPNPLHCHPRQNYLLLSLPSLGVSSTPQVPVGKRKNHQILILILIHRLMTIIKVEISQLHPPIHWHLDHLTTDLPCVNLPPHLLRISLDQMTSIRRIARSWTLFPMKMNPLLEFSLTPLGDLATFASYATHQFQLQLSWTTLRQREI